MSSVSGRLSAWRYGHWVTLHAGHQVEIFLLGSLGYTMQGLPHTVYPYCLNSFFTSGLLFKESEKDFISLFEPMPPAC
jgi:hypothetical protein